MLTRIIDALKTSGSWRLLWLSVLFSEISSTAVTSLMSIFFHGRITHDYLITSGVVALLVSFALAFILIRLIDAVRKAEKSAAEERDRTIRYFDRAGFVFLIIGVDQNVIAVNEKGAGILGYSRRDIEGLNWFDHFVPERQREEVREVFRKVISGQAAAVEFYENFVLTKSGAEKLIVWHNAVLTDGQGAVAGTLSSGEDVTGRQKWEESLEEQKKFAEKLVENSAVATFVVNPDHKVVLWNKACEELTGVPASAMIGTSDQWKPFYAENRQSLADVIIDGNFEDLPRLYGSYARSVLIANGLQTQGWYKNLNGRDRYVIFDAAPIYDSKGRLAVVIETLQDISAQKRMENALAENEARLKTIINTEPECVKLTSADGTILEMNPAGLAMIEADSPDQIVGKSMLPLISDEHRSAVLAHSDKVFNGEPGTIEFEIVGLKGRRRWLETRAAPLKNARGEIYALLGVTRDITERKQLVEKLQEQLRFLQTLIDTIPMPVFYKDPHGAYQGCNRAFLDFLGLRREQIIGKTVYDIAPHELAEVYDQKDRELFERPGIQSYEYSVRHADGAQHEVIFNKATFTDADGQVAGLIGAMLDISERKRVENELRHTIYTLDALIKASPVAIIAFNREGRVSLWNSAAERIFGWSAAEAVGQFNPIVPEEKREEFLSLLGRVLEGETLAGVELVRRKKDGSAVDVRVSSAPIVLSEEDGGMGEAAVIMSVIEDITERKKAEEKILAGERKYRDLFESATDAIFVLDLEGKFIDVNKAAYSRLGYTKEEMLALRVSMLDPPEFALRVPERLAQIREQGAAVFESAHIRKDGTVMPVEINSRMTEYEGKKVYFSIIRDITERKKAEQVIRRNYDAQAAINWILHISLEDLPLDGILKQSLTLLLSIRWLSIESKGSIFMVEGDPEKLVMKTQRGLTDHLKEECRIVPFGRCLCGKAAASGEVQFADALDERHEIHYEGMDPHGHYCVPIKHAKQVVGVINLYLKEGHIRDEKEIEFLNAFADALAGIIQRKRVEGEREKLVEELQGLLKTVSRSHKEWMDTFDSITDEIAIIDKEFRIVKANKAFAAHYGMHPRDVINRTCYDLVHGMKTPVTACPHARTLTDKMPASEEVLDPKTNRLQLVTTYPYFSPEGELIGSIHIARDITDVKEKEMRLIMSERLAALGQMASGIAHEINNPLASIAGCSEGLLIRLRKGQFDPKLFETYLGIIQEEIQRCKNITTGMLSFVRKVAHERKEVRVNEVLDKTLEIIGFQGRLKAIELKKKYGEAPIILGNEGELRQVMLAIIVNSLDAMDDKGVLTLETEERGGSALIRISDSGPGIAPNAIEKIFDPFFTTKADKGGTGLGLSIARKIILNHRGSIEAESALGSGTTFTILLPREPADAVGS